MERKRPDPENYPSIEETNESHLRNLIEQARVYDEALINHYKTDLLFVAGDERLEMNKAADKAEAYLNREPEEC